MKPQSISHSNPAKTLYVNSKKVSCAGLEGSFGHPLIYLDMGKKDSITCPYCSKVFSLDKNSSTKSKH